MYAQSDDKCGWGLEDAQAIQRAIIAKMGWYTEIDEIDHPNHPGEITYGVACFIDADCADNNEGYYGTFCWNEQLADCGITEAVS